MNLRSTLGLLARIALSVGLMVFLFIQAPDLDRDELLPDWNSATPLWLAGALGLTVAAHLLSTLRWQRAADVVDVNASLGRMFMHYMAGLFLSNFVPTTVGGDVLRVRRLGKDVDDHPGAFASVVIERLSGWLVLPVVSFVGFIFSGSARSLGAGTRVAYGVALISLLGLLLVVVVAGSDRLGQRLHGREGLAEWINAVHRGIDSIRARKGSAQRILGAGFLYQIVLILAAGCAVRALGITDVSLAALFAFLPAVLILQVLPIGIGGLGVRESALVLFLGGLGVPDQRSIALGLLLYFLALVSSIIGLPALVFGNRIGRRDDDETSEDLSTSDSER